jgi:hypothetical protein
MKRIIDSALAQTATYWEPLRRAYHWVHTAAHQLSNSQERTEAEVERAFGRVLQSIGLVKRHLGVLEGALNHFLKVTRSYRPGLFHCYRVEGLPRTNNDLEQLFGQHRHQERRATGRKRATVSLVLHGSARLVAGVATRLRSRSVEDLVVRDVVRWRELRASIRQRFELRAQGYRFRRDPTSYLDQLEALALKPSLPT